MAGIKIVVNPSIEDISFPFSSMTLRMGNDIWLISLMMVGFLFSSTSQDKYK